MRHAYVNTARRFNGPGAISSHLSMCFTAFRGTVTGADARFGSGVCVCCSFQDDCIALEAVVQHLSDGLGVAPLALLRRFAVCLDEATTLSNLGALMQP